MQSKARPIHKLQALTRRIGQLKRDLVVVMRKLLHTIWGVWTHDQYFDGEKFYRSAA